VCGLGVGAGGFSTPSEIGGFSFVDGGAFGDHASAGFGVGIDRK